MPAVEDMRALTGEIIEAHHNRVKAISGLRGGVASMLADCEGARQETSRSQTSLLAHAKAANQATVTGMLNGFETSRTDMSRHLHSGLSREKADRNAAVKSMLTELGRSQHATAISLRKGLAEDASARSAEMRDTLSDFEKGRQVLAKSLHANLSRDLSECRHATGAMLGRFDATHKAMSRALRTDLAQSNASRTAEVHAMRKDFLREQAGVRKERGAVRHEWQRLVTRMHPASTGTQVKPVERRIQAPDASPLSAPKTAEPAFNGNPELAGLHSSVFKYLADRPDGTRLVEIEEAMGVSRFQMSRVLRSLMDDNMVEKRDLLYFAI